MIKNTFAFFCCIFLCANVTSQEIKRFNPGQYTPIIEPIVYDAYVQMEEPAVYDLPKINDGEENTIVKTEEQISQQTDATKDEPMLPPITEEPKKTEVPLTTEKSKDIEVKHDDRDAVAEGKQNVAGKNTGEENNAVINIEPDFFTDFDYMFDNASDVTVEEQNIASKSNVPSNNGLDAVIAKVTNNDTFPIRFSGKLESEAGLGISFLDPDYDRKPNFGGYFNFKNYLHISARPHKSISIRGSIRTLFPSFRLDLYQLYVDALLFDKVYLTIGRKDTSWGYTRLFGSNKIVDEVLLENNPDARDVRLIPNVLFDSSNYYSAMVRIPLWTGTLTAMAMYPISGTWPNKITYKDLSYAFSAEMIFLKTSFNLFARFFERTETIKDIRPHLYGLEVKRTILGVDFYLQGMMQAKHISQMGNIKGYDVFVATTGIYRYWDLKDGHRIGGNFEYQYAFLPHNYEMHINQIKFSGAISRMGKNHKIKLAVSMEHNFARKNGYVDLGWQYSDIFPFANWNIATKVEYGGKFADIPKITLGTSINFNFNY